MTENTINIDEILEELSKLYSLTLDAGRKIVIDTISEEYKSLYPVILEEDGLYAVYEDKKKPNELKYVKLKYSKKKINNIIKNIHKQAIKYYLKQKRKEFTTFIQTKKSYLHAKYSYSIDNKDYYNLYYDLNHKHKVASVNAVFINNKQKKRIYPDIKNVVYDKNTILIKEYKNYRNIKNLRDFTKDLSKEIYLKINKKIWIEVKGFNINEKKVYIHIPYKTNKGILQYINLRFKEIFDLKVDLIYKPKDNKNAI